MQNFGSLAVAEPNVIEIDATFDVWERLRSRLVQHLRLLVEHVHDLVERGGRGEECVVELGQLLHGIEEVLHVQHEGEQRSERDAALEVQVPAVAEHDGERDRRQQVDEREVEAVQDDGFHV